MSRESESIKSGSFHNLNLSVLMTRRSKDCLDRSQKKKDVRGSFKIMKQLNLSEGFLKVTNEKKLTITECG